MSTTGTMKKGRGFTHLGRFANAYWRRFGTSPSETLRS